MSGTGSALLDVRSLSGGYGDVAVVHDASFTVADGRITCLIGSNGAGKSTLLRLLSGLLVPTRGSIRFAGGELAGGNAPAIVTAGLIHVPEGRRLFAGMSVADNLLMGAFSRRDGRAAVQRSLDEAFALFPILAERRRQDATTLSGGEQQMCAIARGLMAAPRLLLIDELSLGLAPRIVDQIVAALRLINANGTSILAVEQDVDTALELAHDALVLDQGRIVRSGAAPDLARDPAIRTAYLGSAFDPATAHETTT
jgi:branched-chain amino acid transport system ATP-binding protein